MTKISNQRAYIPDEEINGLDYFVGTDFDNFLKTVNFRVGDLGSHYNTTNGIRNFDFNFYAHSGSNLKPIDGYFYSNDNEKDPNNIEYFIFSKVTASGKIVGTFFEGLVSENPFDLTISQKVDVNSTFYFRIDSVESFTHYYKVNVSEIYFPPVNLMEYTLSFNVFYLKSSGVSQHNNLLGLNEGDFIHLTAAEKTKFDNLPETFPTVPTKTSDLINDGADNTSTYVETNELGAVAFSNDYNDLDNLPPTSTSSTLIREEFVFSGSQTFTLANNYAQIYSVEVQGQGALSTSQYTLVSPNQVTINDTLDSGDYVVIIYSDETLGVIPYYTQAQTDAQFIKDVPNYKFIRSKNDFPTAVSGVITLEDEVTYFIADVIDLLGDRLVLGSNTVLLGSSSENSILTSTGLAVGVPLLSSIYTNPIRHISINDVDTAISFDGATNPNEMALDWTGVNFVNVPNVGLIKDAVNFIFDKGAFLNSKGLLFDGTIDTIGFGNCLFSGDGLDGNIIEITDTSVINRRFRIIYSSIVAFALTKGIKVGASAGISEESYILDTVNFSGGGTYLDGTNHTSEKSLFVNCVGIVNTESLGSMYMKNNATETVITVQGDRYNIAGTTQVNGINQRFEHDLANNALQYTGIRSKVFHVNLTFTLNPASNNQKYGIYIGVNKGGAIDPTADRISESEAYINTPQSGRADAAAIQALVQLDPNDRVYMIVQNTTSTANVTVEFMNLVIK